MFRCCLLWCLPTWLLIVGNVPSVSAQLALDPTVENAKKVGSLIDRNGAPLGSCFYLDQRGYVATTFSNVERTADASVTFNTGDRFQVIGVVAASRGKDIAILALRGISDRVTPLSLRADAAPVVGDNLMRWGGPASAKVSALSPLGVVAPPLITGGVGPLALQPADSPEVMPRLARKLKGDEILLGAMDLAASEIGGDPDTEWLLLDQPRHRSCIGGPVFDRAGDVVAMVSGCLETKPDVHAAVHAKHIFALVPAEAGKLAKLSELRSWKDPLPRARALPDLEEDSNTLGSRLDRGHALAARFTDFQRRLTRAEQEDAAAVKSLAKLQARNLELPPEVENLERKITAIIPEDTYTDTETEVYYETEEVDERGNDGKKTTRKVRVRKEREVKVTKRRYSRRQLDSIEPLRKEVHASRVEMLHNLAQIKFLEQQDAFNKQVRRRVAEEWFYLSDPLNLRSREEHRDLVATLTSVIDEGGAPAIVYMMRAMSRITLDDFDNARLDLAEAVDADTKCKYIAQAVEARCKIRQGKTTIGDKEMLLAQSQSKNDPRVLILAARGALDHKDTVAAAKLLNLAIPTCPDQAELRLALAWVFVTAPGPSAIRIGMSHAEAAVRLTAGHDWNALAALAAAHARAKQFDKASSTIQSALQISPPSAIEMCQSWKAHVAEEKQIVRDWQ